MACLESVNDIFEYWGVFDLELFLVDRLDGVLGTLFEGSTCLDVFEFLDDVEVRRRLGTVSNRVADCSSSAEL